AAHPSQIGALRFQWDPSAESSQRYIEQLRNHPPHAPDAVLDAPNCLRVPLVEGAALKQQGSNHTDPIEWVSEVMSHDSEEHFSKFRHFGELPLARLRALLGLFRRLSQLLRPNRSADQLLIRFAQVVPVAAHIVIELRVF